MRFDLELLGNIVVGHLIDGEEPDWIPRARIILAGGAHPVFPPYDRFRHRDRNARRSLASLLREFATLRASNLGELRSWHLASADLGHIAQSVRVMAKPYREELGPFEPYLPVVTDRPVPRS